MPTPYEEISNERSNREAVKTDANLAQDSLQLGGIDAEEYALKSYVKEVDKANSTRDQKYTDDKIKQLSEDLKGYTDTAIGKQDFTDFTRKKDLETVQEQLKNTINDTKTNLEETINQTRTNLEEKIDQTKIELQKDCAESCQISLETAKKYTDGKYNVLFQSVSDGKSKIAEAITDKGVNTSANDTYDKMADNISKIETGLDTSDATATSSTILRNYTAYAKGQKITGIYEPLTLPDVPTYGIDTSDATASPSDIKVGKTAYVNGEKITGTLQTYYVVDPGDPGQDIVGEKLPEIYDITNEDYKTNNVGRLYDTFDEEKFAYEDNTITNIIASDIYIDDKNTAYIARITKEKDSPDDTFICINEIINNSETGDPYIGIKSTYNPDDPEHPIVKKWRYSCYDLELNNENISDIKIGGEGNILAIFEEHEELVESLEGGFEMRHVGYMHFYPIDLKNGIIGNAYQDEYTDPHEKLFITSSENSFYLIIGRSNISNTFAISSSKFGTKLITTTFYSHVGVSARIWDISTNLYTTLQFEASDTILNCNYGTEGGLYVFLDLRNSYPSDPRLKIVSHNYYSFMSDDGKYMYVIQNQEDLGFCKVNIDYDTYTVSYEVIEAKLMSKIVTEFHNVWANWGYDTFFHISANNRFLFCVVWDGGWHPYEVEIDIKENSVEIIKWELVGTALGINDRKKRLTAEIFSSNNYGSYFFFELEGKELVRRQIKIDTTILAIDYKGQRFFSPRANNDVDLDISKITEKEE